VDDWEPPPGMKKFKCRRCKNDFAARAPAEMCPTCVVYVTRRLKADPSYSPFDVPATTGEGRCYRSDAPFEDEDR